LHTLDGGFGSGQFKNAGMHTTLFQQVMSCTLLTAASAQVNSGMQHMISISSNGTGHIDFNIISSHHININSNIFLDMDIGADGYGTYMAGKEHHGTNFCKEHSRH
jgi:hypothetical protein